MALLPIRIWGDPVLHEPAEPVEAITNDIKTLVHDMFDTMIAAPGVGLAAPQVGVPLRLYVYSYARDGAPAWRGAILNPELWMIPTEIGELHPETESEGCLSFPGVKYPIRRSHRVHVTGLNLEGEAVSIDIAGWRARIMQHEFDHLNGITYVNRLTEPYYSEAMAVAEREGWGVPGLSWLSD
ncbi:MAG: peptide deformylase [Ancrocorticia sp.]|jgi:peptide deformylase|nr:peptide deformylase [Ancrocorticia sp.]